jgi:hypothetical protein
VLGGWGMRPGLRSRREGSALAEWWRVLPASAASACRALISLGHVRLSCGTGVWGAWRGLGLGVAVLCVLLRAYQIKRLCVSQAVMGPFSFRFHALAIVLTHPRPLGRPQRFKQRPALLLFTTATPALVSRSLPPPSNPRRNPLYLPPAPPTALLLKKPVAQGGRSNVLISKIKKPVGGRAALPGR